jgi:hypothetical protein
MPPCVVSPPPSFRGAFEAHLTVSCPAADLARFAAACDGLGVKHLVLDLAGDLTSRESSVQPMTSTGHRGALPVVLDEVRGLVRTLEGQGFEVVRTKLEALGRSPDLPATDAEAAAEPDRYFEYHLKLVLPPGADLAPVHATASAHGARLSRNARRTCEGGATERYLTLRAPGLGLAGADARFAALEARVRELPVGITRRIREYVVHDSNLALDHGWR